MLMHLLNIIIHYKGKNNSFITEMLYSPTCHLVFSFQGEKKPVGNRAMRIWRLPTSPLGCAMPTTWAVLSHSFLIISLTLT